MRDADEPLGAASSPASAGHQGVVCPELHRRLDQLVLEAIQQLEVISNVVVGVDTSIFPSRGAGIEVTKRATSSTRPRQISWSR